MRPKEKLSDITTVFADGDWIESKDQSPKGIRLIQTGNVGIGVFKDRGDKARYISEETFDRLNCTEIFPNDCLVSRLPDPVGRSCLIPELNEKLITAVDCTIIRFKDTVIPKYFVYYSQCNQYQRDVDILCTGATRKRISRKSLGTIEIPLPPLETQKAIVVKLDQIFAELDQTKSEIQKNLDNTDELWKSALNQAFQGDWEMKKLGEVCDVRDGTHDSPKYYDEGIPFITSKNLKEDGIDFDNVNYISKEDHINFSTRSKVEVGDILFAMIGTIGNPTIVKDEREFSIKNVALIKFGGAENILNTYVRYLLDSDFTINNLSANSRGGTQKFIALKDIRNFMIPVPQLSEQEKIVEHLDQVSKEVKALKSQYQSQLDNLEELKKSVLDKAFRGEMG